MLNLSPDQVRDLRQRAQCLQPRRRRGDLVEVVRAMGGANAQFAPAMLLSLRARIDGLRPADVAEAMARHRTLVRTWTVRGTLHLVASTDVRWLTALLGPLFSARGRSRRLQLGLDEDKSARGLRAIQAVLSRGGPLTRAELVEQLAGHGVALERKSQAPIHLIGLAAQRGIVCLGPDRENGEPTYVLMDRWVGRQKPLSEDEALAALARRYLQGYGPASPEDFAGWSGLTLTGAKRGWAMLQVRERLGEARVEARTLWLPESMPEAVRPSTRSGPVVRLLPAFDAYVLGYANRDYVVGPQHKREVYHGGQTVPVVLVDGAAAGVWRYARQGKRLDIAVRPFGEFRRQIRERVAEEADDVGRFWEVPVSLSYV